ncbi:hypothetical protein CDD82_4556 [Ophiocordyceps australis]|uniref:BZIP domain-containing protein n=1 Tax=Ophiocordyceps australis TaxID=1399860 RepID=A0A2C5Z2B4_9HYPO|nr:hypothetical protein CDD82_4556 [Ophiocordyceps australis]
MVAPPVHPQLDPPPQASGQMAAIFNPMEPQAIAFAMDSFPPEPDFTMFNSQHYGLVNAPLLDQGLSHAHHDAALTNTNPSPKTKRPSSPQPVHDLGQEGDGNVEHDGGQEGPRKRARGRPRLDTKDETAADRRRTQIRLAQRAYRHRKDTAITTLEQKVKDLENANSSLRKGFGQLVNSCMADGALNAAPRVAEQLNLFADRLKKPSCMLRESSSGSAPSDIDESHMKRSSAHVSVVAPAMTHAQPQRPTGNNVNGSPPSIHMPASLSYEVVTQPTRDNASFPFYSSMEASSADAMAPRVYSRLPPPSSYAAHEVTFGRRLHRANCEAGFRLISMKNPPAHRYAAVFGFCLFFESREAVIERLRLTLSRSQLESLSYWRAPFTSLGGAGTFFTSEKTELASQADGMNLPVGNIGTREFDKQPDSTGFSMGPFGPQVEETRKDRLDPRLRMLLPGFEGDFFDADEVEVYLRKLGITIPRSADYVEVDINLGDLEEDSGMAPSGGLATFQGDQAVLGNAGLAPSDSGYGSISGPACRGWSGNSPETEYRMMPSTPQTIATQAMMAPPPVVAPPFANGMARGGHDLNNGFSAFMCPGPNDAMTSMWQAPAWPRTRVTLDVNKLIDELVHKSVCLVRTPGVRRKDVNLAVKVAAGLVDS